MDQGNESEFKVPYEDVHRQVHVNPTDLVKLVLQFCKENGFINSLRTLEEESKVKLNSVDSSEGFKDDVIKGRWDIVLKNIDGLDINPTVLIDLYEQIVYDLIENDDRDVARLVLQKLTSSKSTFFIKNENEQKFANLENYIRDSNISIKEIYSRENFEKEKRRNSLAENLSLEVFEAEPGRLNYLIDLGIKHLIYRKEINPHKMEDFELLGGRNVDLNKSNPNLPSVAYESVKDELDKEKGNNLSSTSSPYVRTVFKEFNFEANSYIETAKFSLDGVYLITGNALGLIEVWDPNSGNLHPDLEYQMESPMWHKESVTAVNITKDSKMVCSGDISGNIKIFKIANGKCLKEFNSIHSQGVTCLVFTKNNSHVISGSFDSTIKVLGLKSGNITNQLQGHTSFINDLQIDYTTDKLYSASSDGTAKIWDIKNYELSSTIIPPTSSYTIEIPINNVMIHQNLPDFILVSNRSNTVYMISTYTSEIVKYFSTEKSKHIICACLSHDAEWVYAVDEENVLYTFNIKDNVCRNFMKIHDKDVISITHSPASPLLLSYALDGTMKILKP